MSNNFVDNDIISGSIDPALPGVKVDSGPETGPANQNLDAVEFNSTESALTDVKTVLTRSVTGDVSGAYNTGLTVTGIQDIAVSVSGLMTGEALVYNGTQWVPTAITASGFASGDLTGSYPDPTVAKLQGVAISNTAPTSGQSLVYNGTQWTPTTITAGGDLTGTYPNPTIAKLQNKVVSAASPSSGQVLTFSGGQWVPMTPSSSGGVVTGDLNGTVPGSITVIGLQNNPLAASAPNAGDGLLWNGTDWVNTPTPGSQPLAQENLFIAGLTDLGQTNLGLLAASINISPGTVTNPIVYLPTTGNYLVSPGAPSTSTYLYNPTTGTIVATGSLPATPMSILEQVTLLNGTVLATNLGTNGNLCAIYTPGTGTWAATGNLPFNTSGGNYNLVALGDGTAMYVYNVAGTGKYTIYNPTAGTWSAAVNTPFYAAGSANPVVLQNGNVLWNVNTSGGDSELMYLYTPSTQTWTSTTDVPQLPLEGSMLVLPNGNVLFVIGNETAYCYIYNVTSTAWTATGSLPGGVTAGDGGLALFNNNTEALYINATTGTYLYNISGGTWTTITQPPAIVPSGNLFYNPLITAGGGINALALMSSAGSTNPLYVVEFVPAVGAWTTSGGTVTLSGTETGTGYTLSVYQASGTVTNAAFEFASGTFWGAGMPAGDYVFSCYMRISAYTGFGMTFTINGTPETTVQITPTFSPYTFSSHGTYTRLWFPFTYSGSGGLQFGFEFPSIPSGATLSIGLFDINQGRRPADWTYPGNTSTFNSSPYVNPVRGIYFADNYPQYPAAGTEHYNVGDIVWSTSPSSTIVGWVCTVSGTPGTWVSFGGGSGGGGSVTKDLSGTVPGSITVIGLQGNTVSSASPSTGNVLTWTGQWTPEPPSTGGSASGDLTGSYPYPTIASLQGHTLTLPSTITTNYVLTWNGSAWVPASTGGGGGPTGLAGGDLAGTLYPSSSYPAPQVQKAINGQIIFTSAGLGPGMASNVSGEALLLAGLATSGQEIVFLNANSSTIIDSFDYQGNLNLGTSGGVATLSPTLYFNSASGSTAHQSYIQSTGAGALIINAFTSVIDLEIGGTIYAGLTSTKLFLQNGVLGIYQDAANTAISLVGGQSATGGAGWILDNTTAQTSGIAGSFRTGGSEYANFDYKGDLAIGLLNTTNPSLTIGQTGNAINQHPLIIFNCVDENVLTQASIGANDNAALGYTGASHTFFTETSTGSGTPVLQIENTTSLLTSFGAIEDAGSVGIYSGTLQTSHIISMNGGNAGSYPPIATLGSGWGTSPTITVTGGDSAMIISITAGTSPAGTIFAGTTLATVNFYSNWASESFVIMIAPQNGYAAQAGSMAGSPIQYYGIPSGNGQFTIHSAYNLVPQAGITYTLGIIVAGASTVY